MIESICELSSQSVRIHFGRDQTLKEIRILGYPQDVTWKNYYLTTESKLIIYKAMFDPL